MVKSTLQKFYGLVDATNKEELEAALLAFNTTEKTDKNDAALEVAEKTAQVNLGEATLDNGDSIYFPGDNLSEGSTVFTDEAQTEMATAGDYVIDNGDVVSVSEEGIVTSIVTPDGDTEEEIDNQDTDVTDEVKNESVEELLEAIQPIFSEIDARLTALEGANTELSKANVTLNKENESLKKDLSASEVKNEKLAKASAAKHFTSNENENNTRNAFSGNLTGYQKAKQSGRFTEKIIHKNN